MNYLVGASYIAGLVAVYTLLALPVMKYYARDISLPRLAGIASGAFSTLALVLLVVYGGAMRGGGPASEASGILVLAAFAVPAFMISHYLKRLGIAKPFPGIGARTVFAVFVLQSILALVFVAVVRAFFMPPQ